MAGSLFGIYLTVPNLDPMIQQLEKSEGKLLNTQKAVQQATEIVKQTWIQYVSGVRVSYSGGTFVVHDRNGEYIRSIQTIVPYRSKTGGIVFSDSEVAQLVEDGYGPFDMKPGLLKSSRARTYIGKDGKEHRYLTVPFRHNVPGANAIGAAMPTNIYNQARKLDFSYITGRNSMGYLTYKWGGRLGNTDQGQKTKPPVGGMDAPYPWTTGPYSGMVRMYDAATGKSGGYLTFRRVSDRSNPNSWWHPGVKPRPVTRAVIEATEKPVLDILRTGLYLDLAMAGIPIPQRG